MAGFGYRKRDDLPLIAVTAFFILWSLILLHSPLGPFAVREEKAAGGKAELEAVPAYNPDNLQYVEENVAEGPENTAEETFQVPAELSQNAENGSLLPGNGQTSTDVEPASSVPKSNRDEEGQAETAPIPPAQFDAPLLAFIIDDWGYAWPAAEGFLQLDAPMTYAVLPYQKYSREHAKRAKAAGYEVILHLPMAPLNPDIDPGPKAIWVTQDEEEIRRLVLEALAQVPEAVGVNNHMGSGATADPRTMRIVLETIAEQGKYFIDSHTSVQTVVPVVAKEVGIPFAQNKVFIDNQADPEYVKERIRLAAEVAQTNGFAIAIGHVKEATLTALQEMIPELREMGIELVTASQLLQRIEAETFAAAE